MADTKEIKIVAGIDTKMDSRATKLLNKTLASLVDPKNLKEANKQYGEMAKIMKAIGVDQGKITKMMDKDMLGGIKKSTVAIKEYARELDRVKKIQGRYASGAGQEGFIARHAMGIAGGAEAWRGMSEADRVAARQLATERWQRNQANYTAALDRMEHGAKAIAMERVSQDEEARMTARQRLGSQLYTAGVGVQMAAGLVQGGLSMEAQTLQNKAAYLGFGRNLYNQLASGDIGGVQAIRAIMKDPGLAARIAENARLGSQVGNIGQAGAGTLKLGGSLAMGGGGMLMGGGAAANDMLAGAGGIFTDEAGAAESRAAMAAISAQGTLDDPRFQRAMGWMHANRSQMAYRERMGMGGADLAARMGDYGRFAGLDVQRSLGVHDEMARALGVGQFGNNMAEGYAGLAMAAQATRGVDVGAATRYFAASGQSVGALGAGGFGGRYQMGQDQRSKEEFERTLARGFAAGFKDPNVRNALVDYAAQAAVNVYSGRGGGAQGIGELMAMGMGQRDRSDVYEQRMAMSGYDVTNKALAGGSGYYGSLRFSTAGRTLRSMKGGGDAYEQSALGTATMDELGSILSGNVPDRILSAFGGNKARAMEAVRKEFGAGSIGPLLQSVAPDIGRRYGEIYAERKKIKGSDLSPESIYKQIWEGVSARDREVREKSYYAATQNFLGVQGLGAGEARSSMDILFGLATGGAKEAGAPKPAGFFTNVLNQLTGTLGQGGGKPGAATVADVQVLTAQLTEVKDASGRFAEELTTIYKGYQAIMNIAQYDGGPAKILNDAADALDRLAKAAQPLADLNVIQ